MVRKFYPGTLAVEITERKPFALWQRDGKVTRHRPERHARSCRSTNGASPSCRCMVGGGANQTAPDLLADLLAEPTIAEQMRAAVLVAGRRWDLHLENGVTVQAAGEARPPRRWRELVKLDAEKQLLSRDVVVIDLRLPDRVTVRLPEGRSLDDVTSDGDDPEQGKTRT